MSEKNLSKIIDNTTNKDNSLSNMNNNFSQETLIEDLSKMENIFLISSNFEPKIIDILLYLQSDENLAINKIKIIKFLQSLFINIDYNLEIFMRKFIKDKERLNLYQIIIYQYILYGNPRNSKAEEEQYRSELHNLLIILLSKISLNEEIHRYIFSFIINFSKKTTEKMNYNCDNSEYLSRFLELLTIFYNYNQIYDYIPNYFFSNGENKSSIIITNKDDPKNNKNILNLNDTLCIMIFIKIFPSKIIKALYPDLIQNLIEIRFNYKNLTNININMDNNNNLFTNYTDKPLYQLSDNQINCIIIKLNNIKKNKIIITEIFVGKNKINPISIPYENEEEEKNNFYKHIEFDIDNDFENEEKNKEKMKKSKRKKNEIREIILFQNFIGICSNIIIYREKNNEGFPKFLEDNNLRNSLKEVNINKKNNSIKSLFSNGIYSEELFSYSKNKLEEQDELNILDEEQKININNFKDFVNNSLISIYIPTRFDIPQISEYNEYMLSNAPELILKDSINNLDAKFQTTKPCLNGVHIYSKIQYDFGIIGSINNLLIIIELMANNEEFLNNENLNLYFNVVSNFIFSSKYKKALIKANKSINRF